MMIMYRAELSFDILVESEIGKTLNHLLHFCKIHEEDLAQFKSLASMADKILTKWKNFVMHTIFDDHY